MRRSSPSACSAFLILSALGFGCKQESADRPPLVIDARPAPAPAPAAQPAPTPLPAVPPSHPYDPADPLSIPSIQVSGEIALTPEISPPRLVYVYVSKGDCLDEKAQLVQRVPVTESGSFLAHLIAVPGSEFSLCAAAAPGPDGTTRLYGQAASRLKVTSEREQSHADIKIDLRPSPPHRFPTR